jgi:hypothetical protein
MFADAALPTSRPATLSRTVAAARLELHIAHVDKMIRAGMLPLPITTASVEALLGRPRLRVTAGELTVLRTDARQEADRYKYPDDARRWTGFHVDHSDADLAETSLRWWRCDPIRVLDNELFAVTVATFPVAVYRITDHLESLTREDEELPRQHFGGQLLARVSPGMHVSRRRPFPGHLEQLVDTIMASRITVSSGGPIGYLDEAASQ